MTAARYQKLVHLHPVRNATAAAVPPVLSEVPLLMLPTNTNSSESTPASGVYTLGKKRLTEKEVRESRNRRS
jgi:hypothetical protein